VLHTATVRERFMNAGSEIVASPPGQLAALVKSDMAKYGKLIREIGVRSN